MRVFCAFTSIIGLVPLATIGRPRGLMSVTSETRLELLGSPTNRQESFIQHSKIDPDKSDRKSTRLNSSHVRISYAVFCLKKKKKKISKSLTMHICVSEASC